MFKGINTPWGRADFVEQLGPGVWSISTPSHGGVYVGTGAEDLIPGYARDKSFAGHPWYEEDADWAIPMLYIDDAEWPEEWLKGAVASIGRNHPALLPDADLFYTRTTGRAPIGVPYAEQHLVDGVMFAECPACGEMIRLSVRKDFESYTGEEYARHWEEHMNLAEARAQARRNVPAASPPANVTEIRPAPVNEGRHGDGPLSVTMRDGQWVFVQGTA